MASRHEQPGCTLSRRDYVLLPAIVVLTVLLLFFVSEMGTRLAWSEAHAGGECHVSDNALGVANVPNCTMRVKVPETGWITYHYNECGFRSTDACGPKPAGAQRVAILGSSFAEGSGVAYADSFGALSEAQMSRICSRPVEFQNLGTTGLPLAKFQTRVGPALRLRPDAAMLVVAPFDLEKLTLPDGEMAGLKRVAATAPTGTAGVPRAHPDLLGVARGMVQDSRAISVAEHFMFENPEIQVSMYLRYGDKADFLRQPFSRAWQQRLAAFDQLLGDVADRFRMAGVPLLLVVIPQRAQAELLTTQPLPSGVDPFALGRAMSVIAQRHGVRYVDLFTAFSHETHPARFYYPVDNHLNEDGSQAVAHGIIASLSHSGIAAFDSCNTP
ncbi:hypothetical protein [Paraburkholderia sp. BL10I2N1]|uniref:alginate O-acetyltransferase AlgX-related protein n=1 Tax=Paraburkholderia sp. BL10I2N1 TaxID=1938796 RepID=UPI0010DF5072|nr:hypothetical protein [Paraburkholderia sp. BL10I2N1]TDN67455.1 acetyltransferase AlgX (SGNH hydrolase-like protein) [Paraburkholderia sp. BL10I2N1]